MGMMFRRNKLRRKEQEMRAAENAAIPVSDEKEKMSVKDEVPPVKRRGRKPKA